MKLIINLLCGLLLINCYADPGDKDEDPNNIMDISKLYGMIIAVEQSNYIRSGFQIYDLKITSNYPYIKVSWSTPGYISYYKNYAQIGVSTTPILSAQDCQSKLLSSGTIYVVPAIYSFSNIVYGNNEIPLGGTTDSNSTIKYCSFCTQGTTLYFCAITTYSIYEKLGGGSDSYTNPWNGSTVEAIFN